MSTKCFSQAQEAASAAALAAASASGPRVEYSGDVGNLITQLQPVWAILPSAEARASKLGNRSFRTGSPTGTPMSPRGLGASLSEMDVRSLKNLYDPKGYALSGNIGGGSFSIEAFVDRVQALIADDRALVERLIRFAQAHDLLKKNAERAQKLAQDSNFALETYQKQVNTLEERNLGLIKQQTQLCVLLWRVCYETGADDVGYLGKMSCITCRRAWTDCKRRSRSSRCRRPSRLRPVPS